MRAALSSMGRPAPRDALRSDPDGSWLRRPRKVDQKQAVGHGDCCPRMFSGDDRDLALAELDPVLPYAKCQPTFEDVERQRPSLVVLVERRASPERNEDQSKRPGLDQRAGIPVAVDVSRFRAQPGGLLCEVEPQQSADQRARLALIASTRRRESV